MYKRQDFKYHWISKNEIPSEIFSKKEIFLLFDFMGNYEFFEKEFDYDEVLKLPSISESEGGEGPDIDEIEIDIPDPIKIIEEIKLGNKGMRIDRDLYPSFKKDIQSNEIIKEMVENLRFDDAEKYLVENILDKPKEFYTLDKLKKSLELDRKLTVSELLLHAFDYIDGIKSKSECIQEEFERFDDAFMLDEHDFYNAKQVFEYYVTDEEYRRIIDSKQFAELYAHDAGLDSYKSLPKEIREQIPNYVKQNIDMERLISA